MPWEDTLEKARENFERVLPLVFITVIIVTAGIYYTRHKLTIIILSIHLSTSLPRASQHLPIRSILHLSVTTHSTVIQTMLQSHPLQQALLPDIESSA